MINKYQRCKMVTLLNSLKNINIQIAAIALMVLIIMILIK